MCHIASYTYTSSTYTSYSRFYPYPLPPTLRIPYLLLYSPLDIPYPTPPLQYVTDVDSEVSKRAIASIGLIAIRVPAVSVEMTQQ
jgi:hypothetical protein